MKKTKTKLLIESSLMVALATVLSVFKLAEMPYGGSVTMASMLPIIIISYRCGIGWGLAGGLTFAVIQQLLGLKNLSYFTTWQSIVAIILLDYILAFTAVGLCGIFRTRKIKQKTSFVLGGVLASLLRYACHVISGATVWAGLSIPDSAALIYSLGYNATYMIPEAIILIAAGYYLGDVIDFSKDIPQRLVKSDSYDKAGAGLYALAGGSLIAMIIADVSLLAPHTQNPESGMFDLAFLKNAPWVAVIIISAVCIFTFILSVVLEHKRKSRLG